MDPYSIYSWIFPLFSYLSFFIVRTHRDSTCTDDIGWDFFFPLNISVLRHNPFIPLMTLVSYVFADFNRSKFSHKKWIFTQMCFFSKWHRPVAKTLFCLKHPLSYLVFCQRTVYIRVQLSTTPYVSHWNLQADVIVVKQRRLVVTLRYIGRFIVRFKNNPTFSFVVCRFLPQGSTSSWNGTTIYQNNRKNRNTGITTEITDDLPK